MPDDDRDDSGKFKPGNQAAVGARRSRAHQLKAWFRDAVSEDDVRAIAQALVLKAKDGDARAAALLLDRLYGRPRPEPIAIEFQEAAVAPMIAAIIEAIRLGEVAPDDGEAITRAVEFIHERQRYASEAAANDAAMRAIWGGDADG